MLIHLGPLAIRWYALAYIAGLLLGWWMILRMLRDAALWKGAPFGGKPPATADDIGDLVVWTTLGVILGGQARLGDLLRHHPVQRVAGIRPIARACRWASSPIP